MSKLIAANELASKSIPELRSLFKAVHADLVRSEPGSHERLRALASLENISRAMAQAYSPS